MRCIRAAERELTTSCSLISPGVNCPLNCSFTSNRDTCVLKTPRPGALLPSFPRTGKTAGANAFHSPRAFLRVRIPRAPRRANLDFNSGRTLGCGRRCAELKDAGWASATHPREFGTKRPLPLPPPFLLPRLPDQQERPDTPRRGPPPTSRLDLEGAPLCPHHCQKHPFQRDSSSPKPPSPHPGSAITGGLGGLTVPPTGRKEGSQDEKEEEGRQAGIGCRTRGLAPACPRAARPPPSRIWASAQSLPAAARGTCPSLGPGADAASSGAEPQAASPPAPAFHPEKARTPFMRPAASLPPNQPQVNPSR